MDSTREITLVKRAQKAAKEKGVKIPRNVLTGLKAIQKMCDISKKYKGSAYEIYMEDKQCM